MRVSFRQFYRDPFNEDKVIKELWHMAMLAGRTTVQAQREITIIITAIKWELLQEDNRPND